MKKLLMTASTFGHIKRFHQPYLEQFKKLGWTVHVACGGQVVPLAWTDELIPVPFEKRMSAAGNVKACRALRKKIKAERYDLVVTHTSLAAFFTRLAAAGLRERPKLINVMHGYLFGATASKLKGLVLEAAEVLTAPWTDLVLTMNAWDDAWARAHHAGKAIENIPGMGVDPGGLRQAPEAETGFGEGDFVLLYAAEFSERKNQAMLIRAMALLPERVKLLLPGEGALLEQCRALAGSLGLAGRVRFPGYVEQIGGLLRRVDVLVSSSRSEGLPFNIMEGMLMGLPVIASRVKGHTDLVDDGRTGLLYDCGDEGAFAAAVEKLLEDGSLCERFGEAGREKAGAYTLDNVMPQVMKAYLSVL